MRRILAVLGFVLVISPLSFAVHAAETPAMPLPLMMQQAKGAQVYYLGKFDTLDSWAMIRTGQPEFYYATPGNKALVMGLLFDAEGNLQTGDQLKNLEVSEKTGVTDMMASKLSAVPDDPSIDLLPAPNSTPVVPNANEAATLTPAPRSTAAPTIAAGTPATPVTPVPAAPAIPAPVATAPVTPTTPATNLGDVANTAEKATPATRLFSETQAANTILWGQTNVPAFYAYLDPNCPHCQRFLREVEPYVIAGKVAVHMVPVAFDDKSRKQAAFAVAAADGAQRMVNYAKGDTTALPTPADIKPEGINANTTILEHWNLLGTPMILYRAGKTNEVRLIRGRPLDVPGAVKDLVGQ